MARTGAHRHGMWCRIVARSTGCGRHCRASGGWTDRGSISRLQKGAITMMQEIISTPHNPWFWYAHWQVSTWRYASSLNGLFGQGFQQIKSPAIVCSPSPSRQLPVHIPFSSCIACHTFPEDPSKTAKTSSPMGAGFTFTEHTLVFPKFHFMFFSVVTRPITRQSPRNS